MKKTKTNKSCWVDEYWIDCTPYRGTAYVISDKKIKNPPPMRRIGFRVGREHVEGDTLNG